MHAHTRAASLGAAGRRGVGVPSVHDARLVASPRSGASRRRLASVIGCDDFIAGYRAVTVRASER
jgi:hypothetical protein